MTIVEAIYNGCGVAYIGDTDSILRCMFPQADAHVKAWREHKWIEAHKPYIDDPATRSQFLIAALLRDQRRGALNDY